MPTVHFTISGVPVVISARSPTLVRLFAEYFRYYDADVDASVEGGNQIPGDSAAAAAPGAPLSIELKMRRGPLSREALIPTNAELFARTGVVSLWREKIDGARASRNDGSGERFYFDMGAAAFRVDPELSRATGLITPQSLEHPQILTNTYTLFALALLLRSRGLYHLHAAAAFSPHDELWLICGPPRSGKTTLATALGLAGWRPISDDSLVVELNQGNPRLSALRKHFHVDEGLLADWRELAGAGRGRRYSGRVCVEGLEFFGARELAGGSFGKLDRILLPNITGEERSRLEPVPKSDALLKLAEQSMYFQLWPEHTRRQWAALTQLAGRATCHRLLAGRDVLADPGAASRSIMRALAERS